MCGRYSLTTQRETLAEILDLPLDLIPDPLEPRYNIAPTQPVPILRVHEDRLALDSFRWGLVPSWSKEAKNAGRLINARQETIAEKPSFRDAFRTQRCLVIADGFYEWKVQPDGKRVPHHIRMKDRRPFTFAGLWAHWRGPDREPLDTVTIVTANASKLLASLHDRMPVILPKTQREAWLDPGHRNEIALQALLRPYESSDMEFVPVSRFVNSAQHEGEECQAPYSPDTAPRAKPSRTPASDPQQDLFGE